MAYTLESVAKMLEENIPSLSPTASKVIQLANNINTPPPELTKAIKLDPVLSAKVLKLVNSSYFALSNQIVSLEKAVIMLGLNTIKNLALSAAVLAQMEAKQKVDNFDQQGFWKHSLAVGVTAKLIAQKRGIDKKIIEDYFIAGLLHDLGVLAESKIFPEEFQRILLSVESVSLLDAEEVILEGLSHCSIGKVLAESWKLSGDLPNVLLMHHKPFEQSEEPSELALCVYLANIICKNNGVGLVLDQPPVEINPAAFQKLGIDASVEAEILEVLESEIGNATEFLKV